MIICVHQAIIFSHNAFNKLPNMETKIKFTAREMEILQLISEKRLRYELADLLGISENTLNSHLKSLYLKIGCHSFTEIGFFCTKKRIKKLLMLATMTN